MAKAWPQIVACGVAATALTGMVKQGHGHHPSATLTSAARGGNVALAQRMAARDGWTASNGQWQCLDSLWTRESAGTWSPTVVNPTSGAYGIPQSLPGDKMAAAGPDWQTSARTQILWGLGYIRVRYITPCGAWKHEISANWY